MLLQGTISRVEQVAGSAPLPIPCTCTPLNPELMFWISQAPPHWHPTERPGS